MVINNSVRLLPHPNSSLTIPQNITHIAANISAGNFNAFTAQKGFFSIMWGGIHLWVIAFCVLAMCMLFGVLIYVFKEWINFQILKLTKPQKLIKIVMHYPGMMFGIFWRTIPLKNKFKIGDEKYYFNKAALTRQQLQNMTDAEHQEFKFIIGGKPYNYQPQFRIKYRWSQFPEIHYIYGCPDPISWQIKPGATNLSALEDARLEDSDLFMQLIAAEMVEKLMPIIMILLIIIIAGVLALIGKAFNLIH